MKTNKRAPTILRRARKKLREAEIELGKMKFDTFQKCRKQELRVRVDRHKRRVKNLEAMWERGVRLPYVC